MFAIIITLRVRVAIAPEYLPATSVKCSWVRTKRGVDLRVELSLRINGATRFKSHSTDPFFPERTR